jgi:hypothetical protein
MIQIAANIQPSNALQLFSFLNSEKLTFHQNHTLGKGVISKSQEKMRTTTTTTATRIFWPASENYAPHSRMFME